MMTPSGLSTCQTSTTYSLPFSNVSTDEIISMFSSIGDEPEPCSPFLDPHIDLDTNTILDNPVNLHNNVNDCLYYSEESFNSHFGSKVVNTSLSLLHLNARSLNSKFCEFERLLSGLNVHFDVIAISETWFDKYTNLPSFALDGYTLYQSARANKQGGGVALYVSNNLRCQSVVISTVDNIFESITVHLISKQHKQFVVSCVYRAPGSCITTFCEHLRPIIANLFKSKNSMYVCGDFNINLLNHAVHPPTLEFLNLMSNYALIPVITKPTRITKSSQTVIDNIFTNECITPIDSGILVNDLSDHLPIFLIPNNQTSEKNTPQYKKVQKRKLTDVALDEFKAKLENVDWESLLEGRANDVNDCYNGFLGKLLSIYDKCCPIQEKIVKLNKHHKPWFTQGLKKACRKKNHLYRKFLLNRDERSESKYKQYKNKLTSILRYARKNYYHELIAQHTGDMKNTWRSINRIIGRGKCDELPSEFNAENRKITSNKEISNEFNKFFTDIGPNLASQIEEVRVSPLDYIPETTYQTMLLRPTSADELMNIIKSCKTKSSRDCHDLSMTVLQKIFPAITAPMVQICNISLSSGVFPDKMKIAKVIPLFKSGDKGCFNNYRPVSLLPQFSKLLEKLFNNRLDSFLEEYNILNCSQFGFRSKCNTTHALLRMVERITKCLDERKSTIGIFIDLKKAFDTVNHPILLKKLEKYGIRGNANAWIESYLSQRNQYVNINGQNSEMLPISCGVPQGSILGPKLFILYVNDMCNASELFEYVLFADDTNLFCSDENAQNLNNIVNNGLLELKTWFAANRLSLNVNKTNYMLFSNNRNTIQLNVMIGDHPIQKVSCNKFLGITIEESLSWKPHIDLVCSKMMKTIGIMNKVKNLLNPNTLLMLYNSLLLPHMTYCCEVWGNTYLSNTRKLTLIQKKAMRIVHGLGFLDHCDHLFRDNKIMKFDQIVKLKTAILMFKAQRNALPIPILDIFQINQNPVNTRQNNYFTLRSVRTNKRAFSISYTGVRIWNSIPIHIRNSRSLSSFKKLFTNVILNNNQ